MHLWVFASAPVAVGRRPFCFLGGTCAWTSWLVLVLLPGAAVAVLELLRLCVVVAAAAVDVEVEGADE